MATNELIQHVVELDGGLQPLQVLGALRHRGALLLDGNGKHPEARHAYVACSSRLEFRIHGNQVSIANDDGTKKHYEADPLEALREITDAWKFPVSSPGFTGGFVGVVGYGFTRAIEPTLPELRPATTPDVCLRLCRDVIAFDKESGKVQLWTTDLPGESAAEERAAAIRADIEAAKPTNHAPSTANVEWTTSMDSSQFESEVRAMQVHIRNGDLFQANIATEFRAAMNPDVLALFAALQSHNPSPYMALMEFGDHTLVSGSPEQLFAVQNDRIRARPIAGTRRRGRTTAEDQALEQELLTDAKEQAEHTMLVDLLRNDIARVSEPGSTHVPERGSVERYRRVMHLVSRVEGDVRPETGFVDWLAALFPGGTITGAPKHRACIRIHEAEPVARGHYTGSAGYLNWDHSDTHWNILIRSLVLKDGDVSIHAGSGIVMGSQPAEEWKEAGHKAQALLEAAMGQGHASETGDEGTVTSHGAWVPAQAPGRVEARVLLIDHYDSFVHNLADQCASLGAEIQVIRCDEDVDAARASFQPTHVILGPGPGWPTEAGHTLRICQQWLGDVPILGVCLGHQSMAQSAGATIQVANRAVHGEIDAILHQGSRLLEGLPAPLTATRYHSLVVDSDTIQAPWHVTARLEDGTVMAMEHSEHAAFGLQFHPESIGTDHGLDILFRFLSTT